MLCGANTFIKFIMMYYCYYYVSQHTRVKTPTVSYRATLVLSPLSRCQVSDHTPQPVGSAPQRRPCFCTLAKTQKTQYLQGGCKQRANPNRQHCAKVKQYQTMYSTCRQNIKRKHPHQFQYSMRTVNKTSWMNNRDLKMGMDWLLFTLLYLLRW